MPIHQTLPIGASYIMLQNVEYALPPKLVYVTTSAAVDVSVNGVAWSALTNANTVGAYTGAAYIRCTTAQPTIVCKA
jgi:hypothetical protein